MKSSPALSGTIYLSEWFRSVWKALSRTKLNTTWWFVPLDLEVNSAHRLRQALASATHSVLLKGPRPYLYLITPKKKAFAEETQSLPSQALKSEHRTELRWLVWFQISPCMHMYSVIAFNSLITGYFFFSLAQCWAEQLHRNYHSTLATAAL